jgi:YVTN family beta-propeller protein
VDPTVHRAYIANEVSNTVSVIDTTTNSVVGTPIPVGNLPIGVGVDSTVHRAYVANSSSNTVSVIDTTTNFVSAPIPVGTTPNGVGVDPTVHRAYVANNNLTVITRRPTPSWVNPFPAGSTRRRGARPHCAPCSRIMGQHVR